MHEYHESLPGYDAGNVLHDGCEECERRAADPLDGLCNLDHKNFRQAWADMLAAKWSGGEGLARRVSGCDNLLHRALYLVAVLMERSTGTDPRDTLKEIDAKSAELDARLTEMFG